jgi:hypothetical protein
MSSAIRRITVKAFEPVPRAGVLVAEGALVALGFRVSRPVSIERSESDLPMFFPKLWLAP